MFAILNKAGGIIAFGTFNEMNTKLRGLLPMERKGLRVKHVHPEAPIRQAIYGVAPVEECSGCCWKNELDGRHCETCRN